MISIKKVLSKMTYAIAPVGSIINYIGTDIPDGWLLCDGSAIPHTYTELIALVGSNTPNLTGKSLVGCGSYVDVDNITGTFSLLTNHSNGSKTATLTTTELPSHNHTQYSHTHSVKTHTHNFGRSKTGTSSSSGYYSVNGSSEFSTNSTSASFTSTTPTNNTDIALNENSTTTNLVHTSTSVTHENCQSSYVVKYLIATGFPSQN